MLFDDPSSSSPSTGDAGFADLPSRSSRRPRAPSLFAHRAIEDAPPPAGSADPLHAADPQPFARGADPQPFAHAADPQPFARGADEQPFARGADEQPFARGADPRASLVRTADTPAPSALAASAADAPPPAGDPRLIETAGAPAPEALQATRIAASVVRELYETGREVRFAFAPTRERVTVLLCDMDGAVLSRLTPARALEIATGEPVPGGRRR